MLGSSFAEPVRGREGLNNIQTEMTVETGGWHGGGVLVSKKVALTNGFSVWRIFRTSGI